MPINKEMLIEAKKYINDPKVFIQYLKDNGLSKSQCMIVCNTMMKICPTDAKKLVHFSSAWTEKISDEKIWSMLYRKYHKKLYLVKS